MKISKLWHAGQLLMSHDPGLGLMMSHDPGPGLMMSHDPGPGLSYASETQVALTLARFPRPCPLLLPILHCNKTKGSAITHQTLSGGSYGSFGAQPIGGSTEAQTQPSCVVFAGYWLLVARHSSLLTGPPSHRGVLLQCLHPVAAAM